MRRSKIYKLSLWKSILIIAMMLTLMTSVAYSFYHPAFIFNPSSVIITSELPEAEDKLKISENDREEDPLVAYEEEQFNIVLLGFDRSESRIQAQNLFRPDTIIIAAVNFRTAEVSLLSIPRDSYVKISGSETYDKINHAYAYGFLRAVEGEDPHQSGLQTTLSTIEDLLGGVPLHEYMALDIDGGANIIDIIGGLQYDVEFEMRIKSGKREFTLEEGYQQLDGNQFMGYVRYRSNQHGGDWGRIERQQKILIALLKKLKSEGRLRDLEDIRRLADQYIETNLSIYQVATLAAFALRFNFADINTFILDGQGQLSYRDGQHTWYWVINEEKRVDTIKEIFGVTVEKVPSPEIPGS